MKKTTGKATKAKAAVKRPRTTAKAPKGIRAQASRRTAEGKFTKIIFNQIGGKDCRRFAAMTWKERDAFLSKPENAVVQDRYEKHMASTESKARSLSSPSVKWSPPPARWLRLKKRASSRGIFLLVISVATGEKFRPKT